MTTSIKERYKTLTPRLFLIIIICISGTIPMYYLLSNQLGVHNLTLYQYITSVITLSLVIVGGYQIIYWVQHNNNWFELRDTTTFIDRYIPFSPVWVWVYAVAYYLLIGLVLLVVHSLDELVLIIINGVYILLIHTLFFILFPVKMPEAYRNYENTNASTHLLKIVQSFDNGRACFPSLHCAIIAYVALILKSIFGLWALVMVAIVALSCLFTKQHSVLDIPFGIALGWVGYRLFVLN